MKNPFKRKKIGQIIHESQNIELLKLNIAYHSSLGVDYFLICARDAEQSFLSEIQMIFTQKNIFIFPLNLAGLSADDPKIENRRLIVYRKMQEVFHPDYIFFVDTDEFWIPKHGKFRKVLTAYPADVLSVSRFNALFDVEELEELEEILLDKKRRENILIVHKPLAKDFQEATRLNIPFVLKRVGPKVFLKSRDYVAIARGFHFVSHHQKAFIPDDIFILHVPFTSFSAFENKIAGIRVAFKNIHYQNKGNEAMSWRYWASLEDSKAIEEEYNRHFFDQTTKAKWLAEGVVCRLRDFFQDSSSGS